MARPHPSLSALAEGLGVRRFGVVALAVAWLLHHAVFWAFRIPRGRAPLHEVLSHWDSEWYTRIVVDGYDPASLAYFPLYPALVRTLTTGFRSPVTVPLVGAGLSLVLFATFVWMVQRASRDLVLVQRGLAPSTLLGWAFFLYSPASYVFHTHHTESLFLVLSFGALVLATREKWLGAALLAGLASLTRSQGVLVAVAVAGIAAAASGSLRQRATRFVLCGLVSGALFSCFPLYGWLTQGDLLAFVSAKKHWSNWAEARPAFAMVRALWLGNPWQNGSLVSWVGLVTFYATLGGALLLARRNPVLCAYQVASLLLILTQYELAAANRYCTVLFAALFALGDRAARLPRWAQVLLFAVLVFFNHRMLWAYGRGFWAY